VEHSLTINDTNYIRCTSSRCSQLTNSFSGPSTFSTECQINNDDTNTYEYASTCGIEYRINYDTEQIHIKFQANNDTDNVEDQKSSESLIQTLWLRFRDGVDTPNEMTRKYTCNTKTDCAKDFYLKTIDYLVKDGLLQIELIKTKLYNDSLLLGPKARRRCTDSNRQGNSTSRSCGHGFCFVRLQNYELNEEQNHKEQKCDHPHKPILFSEIQHHIPKSPETEKEVLEYTCNKNVCNRNDMFPKIQNIIKEYTQWNTIAPAESKTINEKTSSLSIKQTISSYTLVLFLIFLQLFV
jgi:hypothetical protein